MRYRIRSALITITVAMLLGSGPAFAEGNACKADLTGDLVVNFADLAVLKSVFFKSCSPTCGDGLKQGPEEQCDDGNVRDGDGCSKYCKIDVPPAVVCGDGIAQGPTEHCDDGNLENWDGCSSTCQIERPERPVASRTGVSRSSTTGRASSGRRRMTTAVSTTRTTFIRGAPDIPIQIRAAQHSRCSWPLSTARA